MFKFKNQLELSPRLKLGVGRGYSKNQILKIASFVFLVVAMGLAINSLWIVINGSKSQKNTNLNKEPQVLGTSDTKSPNSNTEIQFLEYKVKKGDTLFNLSQQYGVSWMTIATLNNLKSPFSIKPGQILKIPK
ncbi:MAG: LysM peptidoglycan-binding domain-containing protein [Candidatus Doudnabacteria bacterium]|nr:LysM peptidoglycan-binding domain-containing protein [Candidatus Doudnabacteria bacterium]